jgi:hypothetical protein
MISPICSKRFGDRGTLQDVLFLDFHAESLDGHLDVLDIDGRVGLFHHGVHALHHLH